MRRLFCLILIFCVDVIYADNCIEIRAAFDIGSGATKIKVAKVDTCLQKIIESLYENHIQVGYKQALRDSHDNLLDNTVFKAGAQAILSLKNEAEEFKPSSYSAVVTSAFRTALNGAEAVTKLSRESGVDIHLISQEKEAKIGFVGASAISSREASDIITWDIGGGSMQITSYGEDKSFDIYEGKIAAVSFKNLVINEVQMRSTQDIKTPNPINETDATVSIRDARVLAVGSIQDSLMSKLRNQTSEVIGIGSVHYYALLKAMGLEEGYTKQDLRNFIELNINKTDEELGGGQYVDTALSNFLLVYGYMDAMNIDYVRVENVNLTNGLLVMPEYN